MTLAEHNAILAADPAYMRIATVIIFLVMLASCQEEPLTRKNAINIAIDYANNKGFDVSNDEIRVRSNNRTWTIDFVRRGSEANRFTGGYKTVILQKDGRQVEEFLVNQ